MNKEYTQERKKRESEQSCGGHIRQRNINYFITALGGKKGSLETLLNIQH